LNTRELTWCGTVPTEETIKRAAKIQLILMDVDGVQTDGKAFYLPNGDGTLFETKGFHSHDGLAFHMLAAAGIKYGAISGRKSAAVEERALSMGFSYMYSGHLDKVPILHEIQKNSGLKEEAIAYVGDDFTDVPLLKSVGLGCAVANARAEVKQVAHFVTETAGGNGAIREVAELVLKAQNKWQPLLMTYFMTTK
jgi:3-deoxy-D-manno-octulosonate 8-phosphate phosphatase (KDO 8-P phosphatase)